MKLTGIGQNIAFKALYIHPYKRDYAIDFIKNYEADIDMASRKKDVFISVGDKIVEEGSDYVITKPVINVAIHPKKVLKKYGTEIDKEYDTVMSTAFSYIPSINNEEGKKFSGVLQTALSLIE